MKKKVKNTIKEYKRPDPGFPQLTSFRDDINKEIEMYKGQTSVTLGENCKYVGTKKYQETSSLEKLKKKHSEDLEAFVVQSRKNQRKFRLSLQKLQEELALIRSTSHNPAIT